VNNQFVRELLIAVVSGLVVAGVMEWYKLKQTGMAPTLTGDIENAFLHPIQTLKYDLGYGDTTQGLGNSPGGTYNHTGGVASGTPQSTTQNATS